MNIDFEDLSIHNMCVFDQIRNDLAIIKYIHVADNYFDYLLNSNHVIYKLIKLNHDYVGGLHIEIIDDYATFSIEIMSFYQRKGIGECVLGMLKKNYFNLNIKMYKVFVETLNDHSIALFTKCGFLQSTVEDHIIEYIYILN